MVLGFALNLGAFTSSVTLHSSFFSSSMDSSFLFLYTHSLCFAINQVLGSALSLAYLFQIIIILQDSSLLQPSYYYHLSNLYVTCITSFVPLSCISLCNLYVPLYPTKYIHLLQEIQINASYIFSSSHLFSSILFSTIFYITNLIILGWLFHFFIPFFQSSISMMDYQFIHLLIVEKQIHSTLFIDSMFLTFPRRHPDLLKL